MTYSLGAVAPFVSDVAETYGPQLGVSNIGGWRASAHDMSGHPAGLALDFMVADDKAKGDTVAQFFITHASNLHIKYLCWQQQIWKPAAPQWAAMSYQSGTVPGYDPNHRRHVHASFTEDVKDGRRLSAGATTTTTSAKSSGDDAVADVANTLTGGLTGQLAMMSEFFSMLGDKTTWLRVFEVIGGSTAVLIGLAILSKDVLGPALSTVATVIPEGRAAKAVVGAATAAKSVGG